MDVNWAVRTAKDWIKAIYEEENVTQLGLEEVHYDEDDGQWRITLGFARPWNTPRSISSGFAAALGEQIPLKRTYKVVVIDDNTTQVLSLENRAEV
jgi:hypothetical protein